MKTMIYFKQVDLLMQLLLIMVWGVFFTIRLEYGLIGHFIVGGWQLTSMLLHRLAKKYFYALRQRRAYEQTLVYLFFAGIATLPLFPYFLAFLFIAGIIMAAWYAFTCYREIKVLHKKLLVHIRN
jgi:hypothetical protein